VQRLAHDLHEKEEEPALDKKKPREEMMAAQTPLATFSFAEVIDRVEAAMDLFELDLLMTVVVEEKSRYGLFHLKLIAEAFRIKRELIL
jgi:hypothetical protein